MSQVFVRPDTQAFLDFLNAMPGPKTHEMTPEEARARMAGMREVADAPIGALAVVQDLKVPGPDGDVPVRLFDARETREPGPLVLYFHGGGFVLGDLDSHAPICGEIARTLDLPVLAVDYRLSPEYRWPAAPDDCEAVARWAANSPEALGRKVTSLVVAGDSAGGTLAIVVAMDLRDRPAAVPVIAQFPIYPAADLGGTYPSSEQFADGYLLTQASMDWFSDAYAADLTHMRGSPMEGTLEGLPPAVVITAGLDPIRDQGRAYAAALAKAGVPVVFREAVGNIHGFVCLRKAVPSSQGDVSGALAVLKPMIVEAEAARVMAQAAG